MKRRILLIEIGPKLFLTGIFPSGVLNSAYTAQVSARGGTAPYVYELIDGALPDGWGLDTFTGIVAGSTDTAGLYTFTIQATDARGATTQKTFSVRVAAGIEPPDVLNYIAFPLTYDEEDYANAMTWTRQGNGPHITPLGFEGDGYEARYMSTTIPAWMQDAASPLLLHAQVSFYPQKLKSSSEFALFAGGNSSTPYAKLLIGVAPDATNAAIPQLCVRAATDGSGGFVSKALGRSAWKYRFRIPDLSISGTTGSPQGLLFLDGNTLLFTAHFGEALTRVYKIELSDFSVVGHFDCTGDFGHMAVLAKRSNGDIWAASALNKACRIDLDGSLSTGTLVVLDTFGFSGLVSGALDFVTVGGTEYAVVPEYVQPGSPYFYVFNASLFGSTDLAASDRYKRFTNCPTEVQGCAIRNGTLHVSGIQPDHANSARFGYITTYDIVTAIGSIADGGSLARIDKFDACTKYTEDCSVHPTTNDLWCTSEGMTGVGSDHGGLSVWSSPLDGSLAENAVTAFYDGVDTTTIKLNNQDYDTLAATPPIDVEAITVGGAPVAAAGMTNRYFTGFIRNVVMQDGAMTTEQYDAAVNGDFEPNSLTAYEFVLTNPGAETGTTAGWTNESGGLAVRTYPGSTVPAHGGVNIFTGGASASTIARQRLDILAQTGLTGTDVDAGGIWAKVRWWQASFNSSTDPCGMGLRTLDASSVSQGEAYSGIAWTPNSDGMSYYPWYPRAFALDLPSGARSLDALQKMTRTSGTNNDGWIDDISMTIYRR